MAQGRRLSELLEEQQEPFFLDIYLIENGYSTRIVESQATTMCWPGNANGRKQKLTSNGFKRKKSGLLRCMVSKVLYSKAVRKALNWEPKAPGVGASSIYDGLSSNGNKTSDWFGCSRSSGSGVDSDDQWRCMEVDSKQLSPVSVLNLHSYESSPVYSQHEEEIPTTASSINSPNEALDNIFKDVADAPHSPAFNQSSLDCDREVKKELSWEISNVDQAKITQLIVSELSTSFMEWSNFQPKIAEIGFEIEVAIFEEICDEAVLDILDFHCT